ncbi:MAG: bifunctional chorismate mutase/prephenate dehydrogenase [bacterium]|nr:bifunctional chorismate mutase/prephenate dehydrogenase [bacterium]
MSQEPDRQQRPLAVLRAMIDTVDRDLVHLLARRTALVGEVAGYKREHRLPIRDPQREREILEDRLSLADELALSPSQIESLFRLILWGSRDRQATLKAEVPPECPPRVVGVVGGMGEMGGCLVHMFRDLGNHVIVADLQTSTTPAEVAEVADVVVIAVPIDVTESVLRDLGPKLRSDALLMDVTSIKRRPMEVMLESTAASVVGTHPLFGPSVHSLQGQRIVLCPGRGEEWFDWVRTMFKARGLVVTETTPEQHDRAMAIVQVLVHFRTEVMGRTLSRLGVSIDETLQFTSPIYRLELQMTARHFDQSSDLYSAISMENERSDEVTSAFAESVEEVRRMLLDKDRQGFAQMFEDVNAFFGEFTHEAMEQSSYLIDRLVERS